MTEKARIEIALLLPTVPDGPQYALLKIHDVTNT
jgi:hypothetical protein